MRRPWFMLAVLPIIVSVSAGCFLFPKKVVPTIPDMPNTKTVIQTVFQQDYTILNVIGGLCALAAVLAIVALAFGFPVPRKVAGTLIACSVGSWVLRAVLHRLTQDVDKYLWIVEILGLVAIVLAGAAYAYGHRKWIERRLGVDLDGDGRIGDAGPTNPNQA